MGYSKKKLMLLVDGMPAFPPSVYRILKLTADINCAPKDLVRIIDLDPVLTLKLLQLVNSPYFGLSRQIGSIKQAVVFVGINTIKNLALTIAPLEITRNSEFSPFMDNLRAHAIAVAVIAKHLARRIGVSDLDSTDFFVAGLLHDFGKMALFRLNPNDYFKALRMAAKKNIPLHRAERSVFGVDHTDIGAILGDKWCLPAEFVACMERHHAWDPANTSAMQDCVFVANIIAKIIGVGQSGNPVVENTLPKEISERLGIQLQELIGSLGDLSGDMNKAQIYIHP
ncbi:MAG: HDOD domain-containing protein [Magnetococcus sp. YQC-5]